MNNVDKQYLDLLKDIIENGTEKETRAGKVKSVFGRMMRFNLKEGLPLLTTKKVFTKGIIHELLWFLKGSTNIKYLVDNGVHIWDDDAYRYYCELSKKYNTESISKELFIEKIKKGDTKTSIPHYILGDLGKVYGHMWRRNLNINEKNVILIKRKNYNDDYQEETFPYLQEEKTNNEFFNTILKDNQGEEFKVVKFINKSEDKRNSFFLIQYLSNNYSEVYSKSNIKNGMVENKFLKKVCNVGYIGKLPKDLKKISYYNRAYNMWYNMIQRCYNNNHPQFKNYGEKGVRVSKRWHNFSNFLYDLPSLPFFYEWEHSYGFELDKDYYGSSYYSKETSLFLPSNLNQLLSKNKPIKYKNELFLSIKSLCEKYNFQEKRVSDYLNNKIKGTKYDGIENYIVPDGYVLRFGISGFDQIQNIIDTLKTNPDDRRMLCVAFNPDVLGEVALPPCHVMFQFYTKELENGRRELSCMWTQRSVDSGLGLPFNLLSYSLLTHIIAEICDMEVGEIVCSLGDTHIYLNQMEGITEQLSRDPYKYDLPKLSFTRKITNINDLHYEDILIENYQSYDKIKLPLSVG